MSNESERDPQRFASINFSLHGPAVDGRGSMHDLAQIDQIVQAWVRKHELVGTILARVIVPGTCKKNGVEFQIPFFYASVSVFDPVADPSAMMRDLGGMIGKALQAEKIFTTLRGEEGEVATAVPPTPPNAARLN